MEDKTDAKLLKDKSVIVNGTGSGEKDKLSNTDR